MKTIRFLLIINLILVSQLNIFAQTQTSFKSDLLVVNGKNIETKQVEVTLGEDSLNLRRTKKPFETKTILYSEIENAEYTFSDRPRYTAASIGTILFGISAIPVFFMKTKKNWLTINAGEKSAILQLQSENYQMLLIAMQKKGINISDSGNKDKKNKNINENTENSERKSN